MRNDIATTPTSIFRKDYVAPGFWVDTVEMGFDLDLQATHVATRITLRRNHDSSERDLVLFGASLKLLQLRMNGVNLKKSAYRIDGETLRISNAPDEILLEIETLINPQKNTSLSGLYASNGNLITQCEAEGFRKITWFPDRPDVMAKYTVMLRGDKKQFPVLLGNGNLIDHGDLGDGRHFAKWEDPFNKPSYLFALVAGKLVCQEENYRLQSGRKVLLQVWVEPGNLDKTQHAMDSLKNSIHWDEQRFGLELDLDRFMIVATSDFNMGAMENKGLNIFNTKFVLANPSLATDIDYAGIESVVGHEYFHNWTGNRVTCRDWFQLSLKEGLTVFRDQEFSADLVGSATGRAVKRIEDVRVLRQVQFSEDAGPMAHPVRPDSFVEINNFYTVTIYEKGAEVVRMYYTLLGHDGFRKGMDLYFARHDGQAVTCDDFRAAMADSSGRDLSQFERWYSQAGTARVHAVGSYDAEQRSYTLTLTQSCPATPGQAEKLPFHIPVALGLLDAAGNDIALHCEAYPQTAGATSLVLELCQASQSFLFTDVAAAPVPSLLRNFSAPVVLDYDYSDADLSLLLAHDSDPFNRWEAGQRLATRRLVKLTRAVQDELPLELDEAFIAALRSTLADTTLDPAFRELVLTLPSELMIAEQFEVVDPQAIHRARQFMRSTLTQHLRVELLSAYESNLTPGKYSPDAASMAKRGLKNLALSYLLEWADSSTFALALTQFDEAQNMTDRLAALAALTNFKGNARQRIQALACLKKFYRDFKQEALVIDKWFALQAVADTTDVAVVRGLMAHAAFTLGNPNRARSLTFSFCNANPARFHAADGSGYALWAELVIALNKTNPQVAARLARSLDRWQKYPLALQELMKAALRKVADSKKLSNDVLEVVSKALAAAA
ncbi:MULTISPECIES: aminopeptidase N [unclassified Undibacterium]|uniref:aminopeptidase N n=1 Tax=unclassified Undibacterium TaxID=2630295 RepID=UPI002AC8C85C|nr:MULTISPECIES: aminopeptidase N [unclassified Undibacterium]MEB0140025.1 aminopeptidase N [Undibacterium sp. CCC2.1]MEB0173062.1 aminopeptidase N [Undibacterium sp. CCC1.1]MEB0176874.1 aminopeptidase N [Undibacterium sp. CCC3.4]MEB0216106.1 aminopeptidase N [Undibacterium sp. 5I2]WPX42011.1 aminopeptidase N [Undibacterium sp. CCC3.4]